MNCYSTTREPSDYTWPYMRTFPRRYCYPNEQHSILMSMHSALSIKAIVAYFASFWPLSSVDTLIRHRNFVDDELTRDNASSRLRWSSRTKAVASRIDSGLISDSRMHNVPADPRGCRSQFLERGADRWSHRHDMNKRNLSATLFQTPSKWTLWGLSSWL
jgi:hypothetical protein